MVVVVVSVVVSVVMFVVVFVVVSVVDVVVVAAVVIDIDVGASGIGVDLISAVARGGVVESVVVVPVALETVADTTIAGDVVIAQRVDVVTAVNNIDAEEVIDNVSVDLAHAVGIDAVVDDLYPVLFLDVFEFLLFSHFQSPQGSNLHNTCTLHNAMLSK